VPLLPDSPALLIDEQLAGEPPGKAQTETIEVLGPDGLASQVINAVPELALAGEMTEHLGSEEDDPAGRGSGNSRNGTTTRTQLMLDGFNDRIIALSAGSPPGDVRANRREMYQVEVSGRTAGSPM
jgi:hypothetical protein